MSKREYEEALEGPPSKMMREDSDEGGGRSGRVRKKSAKVLEMEEFEQAEKSHHTGKKGKMPKGTPTSGLHSPSEEAHDILPEKAVPSGKKSKVAKAMSAGLIPVASTPVSSKVPAKTLVKTEKSSETVQESLVSPVGLSATPIGMSAVKHESDGGGSGVIKYLLNSPASGMKQPITLATPITVAEISAVGTDTKKSGKKSKTPHEKEAHKPKVEKTKKVKLESIETTSGETEGSHSDPVAGNLKMKIVSGTNAAITTMATPVRPEVGGTVTVKLKKSSKKSKSGSSTEDSFSIMSPAELEAISSQAKKSPQKKASKKKEKLIQDAISAAKQMPNLAALVATTTPSTSGQVLSTQAVMQKVNKTGQKVQKKKVKITSPTASGGSGGEEMGAKSEYDGSQDGDDGDEEGEAALVIAEGVKKKKKVAGMKKKVPKEKPGSPKDAEEGPKKKIPKRAPTAYMLFCNNHRPQIVSENPGIEFAGISRKLGELWSTLSSKQKMQWKRKAQRRMKKGSNLISTGKGGKESGITMLTTSAGGPSTHLQLPKAAMHGPKIQRAVPDDTPQSPTKNFSIEPIDVAAHLKLLGESLSIIGMRLQEHKGMIAVQGSLSVLLDSLLCACGPLLCLTQQVPGMDGCSPLVHAHTLDSVAYVMPGL